MTDYVYAYRLAGDTTLRRVRSPSIDDARVQAALDRQQGKVDWVMLERTATGRDADLPMSARSWRER